MAYKDFTLSDLKQKFQISNKLVDLFDDEQIILIEPSSALSLQLSEAEDLPIKSEKARSELIITPILLELRRLNNKFFTIYSGESLIVDKNVGLTGECDFILAKDTGSFSINLPILSLVEAKRQDIELGINQCAAQLYGAYLFNKDAEIIIDKIYGCVTTADAWKFMLFDKNMILIDKQTYYKSEVNKILGVFQSIIDYYKTLLT